MKKNNLFSIIASFDKKEEKAFKNWVVNKKDSTTAISIKLLEIILSITEQDIDSTDVFEILFPREIFDDAKLRRYMNLLMEELKHFIAFQSIEQDEVEIEKHWLRWLSKKDLYDIRKIYFEKHVRKTLQKKDIQWIGNIADYEIIYDEYIHRSVSGYTLPNPKTVRTSTEIHENHHIIGILYWLLLVKYQNIIHNRNESYPLGELLVKSLETNSLYRSEVINLLLLAIRSLELDIEDETIDQLSNKLSQLHLQLANDYKFTLYIVRSYYANKKHKKEAKENSLKQLFLFEKERNELGYSLQNGKLSYVSFRNMVSLALEMNEIEWAKNYNKNFAKFVRKEQRKNSQDLNKAKILYYEGKLNESLVLFNQLEIDNEQIYLNLKKYITQIYYELNETYALELLIKSVLRNLHRKNNVNSNWTSWMNFYKVANKLLILKNNYNPSLASKLLVEINKEQYLSNKKWLLQKLEEFDINTKD